VQHILNKTGLFIMKIINRMKLLSCMAVIIFASGFTQIAQAGAIPYANVGSYNTETYSFTASATGDVVAYIVGGFSAGYTNELGLLVNGVLSSAGYGLINHASSFGDSFNFGSVNAGDTLVFVNHNINPLGLSVYSDSSLNVGYDFNGDGQNHIYSTAYTGGTLGSVPVGTYVAFEDLQFPFSDYNYNDESFVFTNITVSVPEPSTLLLFGLGLLGFAAMRRRAVK
jgi:hypothetical protein